MAFKSTEYVISAHTEKLVQSRAVTRIMKI